MEQVDLMYIRMPVPLRSLVDAVNKLLSFCSTARPGVKECDGALRELEVLWVDIILHCIASLVPRPPQTLSRLQTAVTYVQSCDDNPWEVWGQDYCMATCTYGFCKCRVVVTVCMYYQHTFSACYMV